MNISDLAARPKTRKEGPGRKPGKKGAAGERKGAAKRRAQQRQQRGVSTEQDVEDHHKGEAGGEPDGADVGVIAFGGFGHEFFDYHIEHCSGGE